MAEDFVIQFPGEYMAHMQQPGGFKTAYEEPYSHVEISAWKSDDRMAVLPLLIDTKKGVKILLSESDLSDYPYVPEEYGRERHERRFPESTSRVW